MTSVMNPTVRRMSHRTCLAHHRPTAVLKLYNDFWTMIVTKYTPKRSLATFQCSSLTLNVIRKDRLTRGSKEAYFPSPRLLTLAIGLEWQANQEELGLPLQTHIDLSNVEIAQAEWQDTNLKIVMDMLHASPGTCVYWECWGQNPLVSVLKLEYMRCCLNETP